MTSAVTRPRIAYDMTLVGSNLGGSGVYARQLLQALRDEGDLEVGVISSRVGTARWMLSGAAGDLRKARPDVYHGPGFLAPLRSPVPVVLTIHDLAMSRMSGGHPLEWRLFYQLVLPGLARKAAAVLTPTEATKREVVEMYRVPSERVAVTPYGIDARFLQPTRIQKSGTGQTILFTGPPIKRKNLDVVLRAMASARLDTALGAARLEIAGSTAPEFPEYDRFIQDRGLQDRVSWLGPIAHDAMPQLYARADVLAYPSFIEGFGFPPLESMACGTPVVASNVSCLPEVLGDSALLVDPNDDQAFAAAVEKLLTDSEARRQVVERGAARARGFTWARCAEKTSAVYRAVAGASASRSNTA